MAPRGVPILETPILETVAITKEFGVVRAVDAVSVRISPGEVVALAGENGSGKSTLARIMAGAIRPDSGTLVLRGVETRFVRPRDALDAGIALVTQEPSVVPAMTVGENVMLHRLGRNRGVVKRREIERAAAAVLAEVGLAVEPSRRFETLGPGERELVELAKALATEPDILILDEVTTRLPDPESLFVVVERLCRTRRMGAVLITHRLREIRRLAHRAVVLRDGVLVGELGRHQLTDLELSSMMVGRELTDLYAKPSVDIGPPVLEAVELVTTRSNHRISFSVGRGEIVGVAGLMGCGRIELLETIAGARRPTSGTVVVDAKRVTPRSPSAGIAAGIGFVPDDRWSQGLLSQQSIVANLALSSHRTFAITHRRQDRERAEQAVRKLTIRTPSVDAPVASLSGGNAQKVVLARALALEPAVLLLSEPTRGVDIGAKAEIYRIIDELVGHGVGIVVSSSDLFELIGLCDRVLTMHDGAIVGELARGEATEESITVLCGGGVKTA